VRVKRREGLIMRPRPSGIAVILLRLLAAIGSVPSFVITTFKMSKIKRSVSDSEALLSRAARS